MPLQAIVTRACRTFQYQKSIAVAAPGDRRDIGVNRDNGNAQVVAAKVEPGLKPIQRKAE